MSNDYSNLEGNESSLNFLSAATVYQKDVKRNTGNSFYLNNVEKRKYEYLYIEGKLGGALFTGINRKLNFSNIKGDTAETEICIKPNMQLIPN